MSTTRTIHLAKILAAPGVVLYALAEDGGRVEQATARAIDGGETIWATHDVSTLANTLARDGDPGEILAPHRIRDYIYVTVTTATRTVPGGGA